MFEARGVKTDGLEKSDTLTYHDNKVVSLNVYSCIIHIITYPELCRGAVQLKIGEYAISETENIAKLFNYALGIKATKFSEYVRGENAIYWAKIGAYTTFNVNKNSLTIEEFEQKLKGIYPVVRENRTTEKQSADNAQCTEPQVEQPLIEDCGNKTLKDNPTIADHIGSHFNLAFQYAVQLEQKNAQLKNQIQFAWNDKQTLINALEQIKTLQTELATLKQPKTKPEQLPVYDAEWLANVVSKYNNYWLETKTFRVGVTDILGNEYPTLSEQDSAPIIFNALAKELIPLFEVDPNQSMYCIQRVHEEVTTGMTYSHMVDCAHIFTSEQAAQKAIDILNSINPQVLKNYFQL
jgi:hypothetical protein